MESLNEDFYGKFIEALKATVPKRGYLCKLLSDILNLEKISVYRRLRGDIPFTFAEIIRVSRQLHISLDKIVNITSPYRSMPFQLHTQDYFHLSEIDFVMSRDYIKAIRAATGNYYSEFGAATTSLPLHVLTYFPPLFRFFMLKWMYQFGNGKEVPQYSNVKIPETLQILHQQYVQEMQEVKYSFFICHEMSLMHLVHDIRYFRTVHLLSPNDVEMLKETLLQFVDLMEKIIINGAYTNGNKVDLYISGLNFEASYSYLAAGSIRVSMIDAYTLGAVTSVEEEASDAMKTWTQSLKHTSTLITGSEKNRILFMTRQRNIINDL